jgi:hypothetical protein
VSNGRPSPDPLILYQTGPPGTLIKPWLKLSAKEVVDIIGKKNNTMIVNILIQ